MTNDPTHFDLSASEVFAMRFAEWACVFHVYDSFNRRWTYNGIKGNYRTTDQLLKEFKALKKV